MLRRSFLKDLLKLAVAPIIATALPFKPFASLIPRRTIFLNELGDDANDGLTPERAKRSLGAAITDAGEQWPGPLEIFITDDGDYENLRVPQSRVVILHGEHATVHYPIVVERNATLRGEIGTLVTPYADEPMVSCEEEYRDHEEQEA